MRKKVVFLDRDGTINQDSADYIKSWSEFKFLPRSLEALRDLTAAGFLIIVITNQSALSRKLLSLDELDHIHAKMKTAVESKGGKISDIFFCPHLPDDGCNCRKPQTGLIMRAQRKYAVDLAASAMIGDSAKDIECARNAACGRCALVQTGNGRAARRILTEKDLRPTHVARDLYDAARWVIDSQ